MKTVVLALVIMVAMLVTPETEAQELFMVPSSCKINVKNCPSNRADRKCNKCCRRAGCDRGDCHYRNCKCKGCSGSSGCGHGK